MLAAGIALTRQCQLHRAADRVWEDCGLGHDRPDDVGEISKTLRTSTNGAVTHTHFLQKMTGQLLELSYRLSFSPSTDLSQRYQSIVRIQHLLQLLHCPVSVKLLLADVCFPAHPLWLSLQQCKLPLQNSLRILAAIVWTPRRVLSTRFALEQLPVRIDQQTQHQGGDRGCPQ